MVNFYRAAFVLAIASPFGYGAVVRDERDGLYKIWYQIWHDDKDAVGSFGYVTSPDGINWNKPITDPQIAPYWDTRLNRFVAYLRFGPPNVRIISRIESEDFFHWSPKVTVVKKSKLDAPFNTELYTMGAMPYHGIYIGVLNTYHGETLKPIPDDQPWMDRVDNQLTFSRDGVTWQRVLSDGAISAAELRGERDWKQAAQKATFLNYGEFRKDWDWGQIYPHHPPLVVGDEIRFYYTGITGRHWHTYHKDTRDSGIGLTVNDSARESDL